MCQKQAKIEDFTVLFLYFILKLELLLYYM